VLKRQQLLKGATMFAWGRAEVWEGRSPRDSDGPPPRNFFSIIFFARGRSCERGTLCTASGGSPRRPCRLLAWVGCDRPVLLSCLHRRDHRTCRRMRHARARSAVERTKIGHSSHAQLHSVEGLAASCASMAARAQSFVSASAFSPYASRFPLIRDSTRIECLTHSRPSITQIMTA